MSRDGKEMSEQDLTEEILAPVARVSCKTLREGPRDKIEAALPDVYRASSELYSLPIEWLEAPATLADIVHHAQDAQIKFGRPLGAIVVDRIEYVREVQRSRDESEKRHALSSVSAGLHDLAVQMQCPVYVMVQFSRACERRDNRRPMLSDLRDSGTLEENAQRVIGVYRHEEYDPDDDVLKGVAELVVLKNKGRTGTAYVQFLPEHPAFRPLHWDNHPLLRERLRQGR